MVKKTPKSILVVEDDTALSEAYKLVLDHAGYTTRIAASGQDALQAIEEDEPDIILLDIRMPVMDGIAFLKEYQPKTRPNPASVIVFSNYDMEQEVDEVYELGAERYVLKAWASPSELVKLINGTALR
ncbi:MAG TPA: response regulator [Candidatus Saccharimonadales bacterium]